jgi:hypothetical protein
MKYVVFLLLPILISCGDNGEIGPVIDQHLYLLIRDQQGVNVFTPETGRFTKDDMSLYYVIDGVEKQAQLNYAINTELEEPVLEINLNSLSEKKTLLRFGYLSNARDTITAEFTEGINTICLKAWYNGELVYDVDNPTPYQKGIYVNGDRELHPNPVTVVELIKQFD